MIRKAKIVATLGPASREEPVIARLLEAGMDVARLNFSHGTHAEHAELIARLRAVSRRMNRALTILQDLQGPKLRVGILPKEGVQLVAGQTITLTQEGGAAGALGSAEDDLVIPMDVPDLTRSLTAGNHILMDDGHIELEVIQVTQDAVRARVLLGGRLTSNKGVNLPGAKLDIPGFTAKDRDDLEFGLQQGVDAVAISFVRTAADIETVRAAMLTLAAGQSPPPLIAKLELPQAIANLDEIILAADGIMVARGDLAVETSPAIVPVIQKRMIATANRHARIVITATQMLESMIENPRPTRAEASDVANAVLDGTDAVMLSAESAVGRYPVESVAMMASIVQETEAHYPEWGHVDHSPEPVTSNDAISITRGARELAHDRSVARIAVFTRTGRTALLMAKARPRVPILAFTPEETTYRRLGLVWGVTPFLVSFAEEVEGMLAYVEAALISATDLQPGQQVVLVAGFPIGTGQLPNFAILHTLRAR